MQYFNLCIDDEKDDSGLPPGVTEGDLDLYRQAREKAQEALNQVCIL